MAGKLTKFVNCRIIRNHTLSEDSLWTCDGKVVDPEKVFFDLKRVADKVIDLNGAIVAPGFIDIQINGGFGVDFSYDLISKPRGLQLVSKGLLSHGVTSFCPTLVTSKPEVYHKVLKLLSYNKGGIHGAEVLGAHVEGPFINKLKKGAHEIDYITDFENGVSTVQDMYGDFSNIRIVTLAPEKENSMDVISWLVQNNITVSLGHSEADVETTEKAVNQGATLITHLYNAMLPFHHRNPGVVGILGTTLGRPVYYGLIADGIHTHPTALRIAYRAHPKGAVLVTDAVSAMGLKDGVHHIGDKEIQICGNSAFLANTNTLCGSVATMHKCVKTFMEATGCSIVEAVEAATLHPAKALGLDKLKGTLEYGTAADFVVLDDDISVISTWINGECVYEKSKVSF